MDNTEEHEHGDCYCDVTHELGSDFHALCEKYKEQLPLAYFLEAMTVNIMLLALGNNLGKGELINNLGAMEVVLGGLERAVQIRREQLDV